MTPVGICFSGNRYDYFITLLNMSKRFALRHPRRNRGGDFGNVIRQRFAALRPNLWSEKSCIDKILHSCGFEHISQIHMMKARTAARRKVKNACSIVQNPAA
jgi:hypothetical protein